MSNLKSYTSIFMEIFEVVESDLNEAFTFDNIEKWDSLTHLTLINELETVFDVFFETDDILHFGSFMNGIEILKKYGIQFDS